MWYPRVPCCADSAKKLLHCLFFCTIMSRKGTVIHATCCRIFKKGTLLIRHQVNMHILALPCHPLPALLKRGPGRPKGVAHMLLKPYTRPKPTQACSRDFWSPGVLHKHKPSAGPVSHLWGLFRQPSFVLQAQKLELLQQCLEEHREGNGSDSICSSSGSTQSKLNKPTEGEFSCQLPDLGDKRHHSSSSQ